MAPKVTSSSNRNKRGSKKPVTKGQNPQRANRQTASNATVSQSGGSRGSGARVTNASQRTTSGSARVTGGARPALPPGRSGGALATRPQPKVLDKLMLEHNFVMQVEVLLDLIA
jgi:hypothetical protein